MRRLLATALLALPLAAHAWGSDGHQTVAAIAEGLIQGSPAEARVAALLGDMPLTQAAIWADCVKGISPSQGYAYPNPGKYPSCAQLEMPARIAEMADYVKRNDRQCELGLDEDACHKQVHYADIAVQRGRYQPGAVGTRPDDVVGALRAAIRVLQGKPSPGQPNFKSQREALIILVHLVGDIHQPLHVGSLYLDAQGRPVDPDKQGFDRASFTIGGNSFLLDPTTGSKNFHSYWDNVPEALRPRHVDAAWLSEARQIPRDAGHVLDWSARWGSESVVLAATAHEGLQFSPKQGESWQASLPEGYEARAEAIKRQQLTKAGARLAWVLKTVFPN
ncbi:S1/P1 nuclease [Roseateles sp. NT4]|uniref:S1/P1 nuclease n=1 Tax=Roseateles sp. NT4 TaxID=3453715 RepID=UPI003EEDDFFE